MRKVVTIAPVAVVLVLIGFVGLLFAFYGHTKVVELSCGGSRRIKLFEANFRDPFPALYYEVYDGRKSLLKGGMGFVGCTEQEVKPRDLQYQTLLASDGSVVGVVVQSDPDVLLALYDFGTGNTWPKNWNTPWEQHKRQAKVMLEKLQANHPERTLQLLEDHTHPIGGRREKTSPNKRMEPTGASRSGQLQLVRLWRLAPAGHAARSAEQHP